ncbi:hypothetical protein F4780DRAFT_773368 [Xylariomycetidae sp. FL0641]|nr:hypothetical protein F4780DRAFT_773368 [Xylariomycetidae sp. FL0641]
MAPSKVSIAVIGTFDTKLAEYLYLRSQILHHDRSLEVVMIDVGRSKVDNDSITISQDQVLKASGFQDGNNAFQSLPRGEVVKTMTQGAIQVTKELLAAGKIHGIVALGGSGGTSIASAVMQELPLLFPKLIVSTVASGDTSSYVGEADITMMYSVVDIAGLNDVLRAVVTNAAAAIAGMAQAYAAAAARPAAAAEAPKKQQQQQQRRVGITMFGVTTPAVDAVRAHLDRHGGGFEVYVFHATGAGGRALERLVREGRLDAVLDLTTTELADELAGGVFGAGPGRLTGAAAAGVPQLVSVGALDMVNFGPRDTVPQAFRGRRLFEHNPSVTLMRTSKDECEELGRRLAERLREHAKNPELIEVWLPTRGVSMIAVEGQPFYDKEADDALFAAVKTGLDGSGIKVVEVDAAINDSQFAGDVAARLQELLAKSC